MRPDHINTREFLSWLTFLFAIFCATCSITIRGQWPRHCLILFALLAICFSYKDLLKLQLWKSFLSYFKPWIPWFLGISILSLYHGIDGFSRYFNAFGLIVLLYFSLYKLKITKELLFQLLAVISIGYSLSICFFVLKYGLQSNILGINKNILVPLNTLCNISCLIGLLFYSVLLNKATKWLLTISTVLALVTLVLAETRTALLAYFTLIPIFLFNQKSINKKYLIALIVILLVLTLLFFLTGRIQQGFADLAKYSSGSSNSSLGIRLVLWNMAFEGFQSFPILGRGPDFIVEQLSNNVPNFIKGTLHLHSDYLHILTLGGLVGLISWLITGIALVLWAKNDPCRLAIILSSFAMGITEKFWNYWTSLIAISIFISLFYLADRDLSTSQENHVHFH